MNHAEIRNMIDTQAEVPATIDLGNVFIQTNFGSYELKDAVWTKDEDCKHTGNIKGTVVAGGETSRILHYRKFTDHAGTVREFRNCSLTHCRRINWRDADSPLSFDLMTCG